MSDPSFTSQQRRCSGELSERHEMGSGGGEHTEPGVPSGFTVGHLLSQSHDSYTSVVYNKGIVEWSTLWADVNTSCVSLVWFVKFLMFNVSNIWC